MSKEGVLLRHSSEVRCIREAPTHQMHEKSLTLWTLCVLDVAVGEAAQPKLDQLRGLVRATAWCIAI